METNFLKKLPLLAAPHQQDRQYGWFDKYGDGLDAVLTQGMTVNTHLSKHQKYSICDKLGQYIFVTYSAYNRIFLVKTNPYV